MKVFLFILLPIHRLEIPNNSQQKYKSQDSHSMAQTICQKHNLQIENVCALDNCQTAFCSECIVDHYKNTGHHISVKLTEKSKEFFITWNDYVIPRISEMIGRLKIKGYASVFELIMKPNYPNNSVSEIDSSEINETALEVLNEHKSIVIQNVTFVSSTKKLDDLRVPDFYKDLYNLFINDLSMNMKKITQTIEKKLVERFQAKKIYKFVEFKFNQRDLKLMEDTKSKLIKVIEKKVITNLSEDGLTTLNKSRSQTEISQQPLSPNSPKKYLTLKKLEVETEKQNPESPYTNQIGSPKSQIISPKANAQNDSKQSSKNIVTSEKTKIDSFDQIKKPYLLKPIGTKQDQAKQDIRSPYNKANSARVGPNSAQNVDYRSKLLSPTTRNQQIPKQDESFGKFSESTFANDREIRNLKGEINKLKIELQDKDKTIKKWQIANDQARKESFAFQKQISSLQKTIVELNYSQEQDKVKTSRDLQDAKFDIQRQKRDFQGKIRALENNLHIKQAQLQRIKRDYQNSRDSLNHKSQFIKDLLSHFPVKVSIRDNEELILKKQIEGILQKQIILQESISKQSEVLPEFSEIKRVESIQDLQKHKKAHSRNNSQVENPEKQIDALKAANQKLRVNEKKLLAQLQKIQEQGHSESNVQSILQERDYLLKQVQQRDQIFELYKCQKEEQFKKLQAQIQQCIKNQEGSNVDEELLEEIVQLEAQIAAKDKDIQILTGTFMECAKKYQIEVEYLKDKFQSLTTVRINIK